MVQLRAAAAAEVPWDFTTPSQCSQNGVISELDARVSVAVVCSFHHLSGIREEIAWWS